MTPKKDLYYILGRATKTIYDIMETQEGTGYIKGYEAAPGLAEKEQILEFSRWKLGEIGRIAASSPEEIERIYKENHGKLCDRCRAGFIEDRPGCNNEAKRFVLARMAYRTLGKVEP